LLALAVVKDPGRGETRVRARKRVMRTNHWPGGGAASESWQSRHAAASAGEVSLPHHFIFDNSHFKGICRHFGVLRSPGHVTYAMNTYRLYEGPSAANSLALPAASPHHWWRSHVLERPFLEITSVVVFLFKRWSQYGYAKRWETQQWHRGRDMSLGICQCR
jgi:hypothetical protein